MARLKRRLDDWYFKQAEFSASSKTAIAVDVACITATGERWSRENVLAILDQGSDTWNEWIASLPGAIWYQVGGELFWVPGSLVSLRDVDLRRRDLSDYALSGIDFSGSRFTKSNLARARFSKVPSAGGHYSILEHCNFRSTNCAETDFSWSQLAEADFSHAELNGAVLNHADLAGARLFKTLVAASFDETKLHGADFASAYIMSSSFRRTNLAVARGLQQAHFYPHNHIDIASLLASGALPTEVYRGLGIPETVFSFLRNHATKASMIQCFISYSAVDEPFVRQLQRDLESAGIQTWFAPKDLHIGARIRSELDQAVQESHLVLLVLSESSVRSHWVEQEVETAFEDERKRNAVKLIPIRLDDAVMRSSSGWAAHLRRTRNIGDFYEAKDRNENYQAVFAKLTDSIVAAAQGRDSRATPV